MAKYLSCGNIMSDMVEHADGTRGAFHLGGPAIFGVEGIRLWEDDCALVCRAGSDWDGPYGAWLSRHGIGKQTVQVLPEETSRCLIQHRPDGSYFWQPLQGMEHIVRFDLTAQTVLPAVTPDVRGVYLYMYPQDPFFRSLRQLRGKASFKLMWEFGADRMEGVMQPLADIGYADMFSCNAIEAARLFAIPRQQEDVLIERLQALPVEMTFFRVGKKGAYVITPEEVWFCPSVDAGGPSVDPSGCGNCSTAAAMYAWTAGFDPAQTAAMACISSGYNAAQYGVWPHFTPEDRQNAQTLLQELLKTKVVRIR